MLPQQDPELRHQRRVPAFHFGLPRPASQALLRRSVLLLRLQLEVPRQEQVRVQRDPQVLLRKAKDFRYDRERHRLADNLVPARLRVFVRQPHLAKRVPVGLDPVCRCAPEADLREDIPSVLAAPANEVAGPDKDPWADNAPVQRAELEFRRLNLASRCTRANRPHRVAVR